MEIKEIKSKACMVKSKLTDYVINPYTGCEHGCVYCYADFIKRFQNIDEKWGEFVFAKVNCPELLEDELKKNKAGNIFMSSVCDCYQPVEKKLKLTRKILGVISRSKFKDKFHLEILTKSAIVKRDFDLIKELNAELGMSVNGFDDKFSRVIEPVASLPKERIETLKLAHEKGIRTFGFISPVTIFTDLEKVFKELKEAGCKYVWVEIINQRKSTKDKMLPVVKENFPERFEKVKEMFKDYGSFCNGVRKEARKLEKNYGLKIREFVVH